jgi:zinc protease
LSEWMTDFAFDTFAINREKGVILQELGMGEEEPGRKMYYFYANLFYKVSPYKYRTIGYPEMFVRITRQDLMDYYKTRYSPNNAVLCIAGDLDLGAVQKIVDTLFSGWERQQLTDVPFPMEPLPTAARYGEVETSTKVGILRMSIPTQYYGHEDNVALEILGMVMSGVATSRLDMRLVNCDNPLAYSISAYNSEDLHERGQFTVSGSFDYQNRDALLGAIWDEIEKIKRDGPRQDEIDWAKRYIAKQFIRSNETVDGQAQSMASTFINTGKPFDLDFVLARINKVTVADVKRVAQTYLLKERLVIGISKPMGATIASDTLLFPKKSTHKPQFVVKTLSNGLRVVLAENRALPTIDIGIYVLGGSAFDPADKPGLASFTADLLNEGTVKYPSFEALQRRKDDLSIPVSMSGGKHTIYLSGSFVATDIEPALDLAAEMLIKPIFPKASESKIKEQQIAAIKQQTSSWSGEISLLFSEKFFGSHPYGRSNNGTEEAVSKFTAEDAKKYWQGRLDPRNMIIGMAGPLSVDEMQKKLEKYFGAIKQSGSTLQTIAIAPPHNAPNTLEKEVARKQLTMMIGFDGPDQKNEADKWALEAAIGLLNGIGGLDGWLNTELRGKRDLVYIAYASATANVYGGNCSVLLQFNPKNFDEAKKIVFDLIDKIKKGDFTEAEMKTITSGYAESYPMSRQTQSNLVSSAALDEFWGLGFDYSDKYPAKMLAITKAEVVRVANKYFVNPQIVITKPKPATDK